MLDELILVRSVSRNQIHVIAKMSKKGFSLRTSRTYCVKSVQIVLSGRHFPVFGLNTEIYSVILRIQSKYRKIWTRKNSAFGRFSRRDTSPRTIQQVLSLGILNAIVNQTLRFNTASKSLIKWKKVFCFKFSIFHVFAVSGF